MGDATGFRVMRLARLSFAGIGTEGLPPGRWRYLTADELATLKKDVRRAEAHRVAAEAETAPKASRQAGAASKRFPRVPASGRFAPRESRGGSRQVERPSGRQRSGRRSPQGRRTPGRSLTRRAALRRRLAGPSRTSTCATIGAAASARRTRGRDGARRAGRGRAAAQATSAGAGGARGRREAAAASAREGSYRVKGRHG